jgi:uncharacterized DUF497 family protein
MSSTLRLRPEWSSEPNGKERRECQKHSFTEEREIIIGHSINHRLVLVCFTERGRDVVRIFSARLATKKERKNYEENKINL